MDETRINTFSPQVKTIALKGQETVKINANNENLKEGTSCLNPDIRFPLAIVAKGTTAVTERKFINENCKDDFLLHSESGWADSDVIKSYLR